MRPGSVVGVAKPKSLYAKQLTEALEVMVVMQDIQSGVLSGDRNGDVRQRQPMGATLRSIAANSSSRASGFRRASIHAEVSASTEPSPSHR